MIKVRDQVNNLKRFYLFRLRRRHWPVVHDTQISSYFVFLFA